MAFSTVPRYSYCKYEYSTLLVYRLVSHNQMGLNRLVCPGDSDPLAHLRLDGRDAAAAVHGVGHQLHSRVPSMAGARESLVHVRAAHHCIIALGVRHSL